MNYNYHEQCKQNNIMATITMINVTIHKDHNEQCIKWIIIAMHNDYNEQWPMNNENEQW